ncbi:hypothetical protein [Erythrobacter litoralis]|uniref:Uncharacterized protein n=1 Tax=Erythrobacter litoralis (strain HTCC2594) TaxID=314225 RepID=Q2NC27_ERYLH|nr:hypothetical protein [Erythrobacter litoralis]ABC62764.1 hypothetical protein ELI_03360 [Erythrobacter litoralis HTCC2594]
MFGADTPLVMDALQMAAVAAAVGAGAIYLVMRRRTQAASSDTATADRLKGRVEVLERIVTDPSVRVASQIEALRDDDATKANKETA